MLEYHVYVLYENDRIKVRRELFCEDDEAAEWYAKLLVDGHAIELWQGTRKLARFDPEK